MNRASRILVALSTAWCGWLVVQRAASPETMLLCSVVVDDAIYFAKPALHFVEGLGFSFDGLHRTNGVQPLWAVLTTVVAWFVRDAVDLLRVMVLLGGLGWVAAGVVLYRVVWERALRRERPGLGIGAAVGAMGFQCAGIEGNLATSGMENGLVALLLAIGVLLAQRLASEPWPGGEWRRRARTLGIVAALLSLSRVEFALLAMVWGGAIWFVRRRIAGSWRAAFADVVPYALPLAVIGGAWLGCSRVYFGEWLPISGAVKTFYASRLADGFDERFGSIGIALSYHVALAWGFAMRSVAFAVLTWVATAGVVLSATWLFAAAVGAFSAPIVAAAAISWWSRRSVGLPRWPIRVLAVFVLCHLVLVSVYLWPFTSYGSWYFTAEIFFCWWAIGAAIDTCARGRWRWVALPFVVVVLASVVQRAPALAERPLPGASSMRDLVEVGSWCRDRLPAGSRIGSWNAGAIALLATGRTVVNLDGLMNDGRYFREYLREDRLPEYLRDTSIRFLADSKPATQWAEAERGDGLRLPAGLVPLWCTRSSMGDVAAVLRVPLGADATAPPPHPFAATLWRTLVRGEFAVTADAASVPADHLVVATYLDAGTPRHVHVDRSRADESLVIDGIALFPPANVIFGDVVELLAVETPARAAPGESFLVTTFWRRLDGAVAAGDLQFGLHVGAATERRERAAHGTLPLAEWRAGAIVAHSFTVAVDVEGTMPIDVVVRDERGEPLSITGGVEPRRWRAGEVLVARGGASQR